MELKTINNKKKFTAVKINLIIISIFLTILCISYTISSYEISNKSVLINDSVQNSKDVRFAFYVNDELVESISNDKNYVFDSSKSSCNNGASITYNSNNSYSINNLTKSGTKCNIYLNTPSFATDSWDTIKECANKSDHCGYNVGDTKTVRIASHINDCEDFVDGSCVSKTIEEKDEIVRIVNLSTPEVCNNSDFSQTGCGMVIEFVNPTENRKFDGTCQYDNDFGDYLGTGNGWNSDTRDYILSTFYNALPSDLRSVLLPTKVVYSAQSSVNSYDNDKLFIYAPGEVSSETDGNDYSHDKVRLLDYYVDNHDNSSAYWLRSSPYAYISGLENDEFCAEYYYYPNGIYYDNSCTVNGLKVAFRVG